jgi:putative FmdB family regulatory protein
MRVYDYRCKDCGHTHEAFLKGPEETQECPRCCGVSARQLSTPRFHLEGLTGDFPGAADRWATNHVQRAEADHKKNLDRKVWEVETGKREYV